MKADYTLCLVTDSRLLAGRDICETIAQAIEGGCTMVQLREKRADGKELYETALKIKRVADAYAVPLIINDRADIALAVNAAGVHVGQKDLPASAVRKLIGQKMILGVSAANMTDALAAEAAGADYIGAGAVFPTATKPEAANVSQKELLRICEGISLPVLAIGGICAANVREITAPVAGAAVISAILAAPDARKAAAGLARAIRERTENTGVEASIKNRGL